MANAKNRPPFRYDIVGSFLRPEALKEKREAFAAGKVTAEELKEAEDAAIRDLVAKEKEVGLKAVTDGEFRRRYWHLDFLAALEGIEEVGAEHWSVAFKGAQPKAATVKIVDKVDFGDHPFIEHFRYLQSLAGDTLAKMTIPSPSMLHLICCVRATDYAPIRRQFVLSTRQAAAISSSTTRRGASSAIPRSARHTRRAVSISTRSSAPM